MSTASVQYNYTHRSPYNTSPYKHKNETENENVKRPATAHSLTIAIPAWLILSRNVNAL